MTESRELPAGASLGWVLLTLGCVGAALAVLTARGVEYLDGVAAISWLLLPFLAIPVMSRRSVGIIANPWFVIFGLVLYCWAARVTASAMGAPQRPVPKGTTDAELIWTGFAMGAIGLSGVALGYLVVASLATPRPPTVRSGAWWSRLEDRRAWNVPLLEFVAIVVVAVAGAGLLLLIASSPEAGLVGKRFADADGGAGRVGSLNYLFLRLAYLGHAVFIVLLAWRAKFGRMPSLGLRLLLPVAGLLAVATPLISDSRAGTALVLVDAVIIVAVLTQRVQFGRIALIGGGTFLVLATMLTLRSSGSVTGMKQALLSTLSGRDLFDLSKLGHIATTEPAQLAGQTLWGWLVFWVPQGLLPFEKPMWSGLGKHVWQVAYGGESSNGVPAGLFGELYLNLGWWGVPIGAVCFGALVAAIYRSLDPLISAGRIIGAVVFSVGLVRFVIFGLSNDLGTGVLSSLSDLLPILLILGFVTRDVAADQVRGADQRLSGRLA